VVQKYLQKSIAQRSRLAKYERRQRDGSSDRNHKQHDTMTTTINYTLPSGKTAIITVAPTKNHDGTISADVTAMVDGVGTPQMWLRTPAGLPTWAVSAIGKLPLTANVDAQVRAAMASINAANADHNMAAAAHIAELDAVSANSAMIARRMAC
jgi:hypothetical protein